MVGEEKRHQMMQNLFGDQSEEKEEEVESEHESNPHPGYASDECDGGMEPEGEGEAEVECQGEAEVESEVELPFIGNNAGESEGERSQSSQEIEIEDQREGNEGKYSDSDKKQEYGQRVVTSRRREQVESGSEEKSEENHYADNEDEEVDETSHLRSPGEEKDGAHISQSAPVIRDVFGDCDDEEPAEYMADGYEKDLRPEDVLMDEDGHYDSEEENIDAKPKEKPVGFPMEFEIPLRPPPAHPDKMHMIKVSNIMGIDPKPFDPKTYVEEDAFVTDDSGSRRRIRLENNIVRWRIVKNPDGTSSYESNARFVRWSDGSLQLLIGNEVLDISVQDAQHDQAHLFLGHGKGILQSQGRLLRNMRFMPSLLSSNSHGVSTALVDSRDKKVYKVKNCITDIDHEREKEQREKAESQSIRAHECLNRKKEKVNHKYAHTVHKECQLSPGFLEDTHDEEDGPDYYESRRSSSAQHRFKEDLEMEALAEKRIINAKKWHKDTSHKSSLPAVKSSQQMTDFSESEREESEYESDEEEDDRSSPHRRAEQTNCDDEEEEEEQDEEEAEAYEASEEEAEVPKRKVKESGASIKRREI